MTFRKKIESFISFTSGERRGILVLLIIMLLAVAVRITIPYLSTGRPVNVSIEEYNILQSQCSGANSITDSLDFDADIMEPLEMEPVDPNTASFQELTAIGFSKFVAGNIVKYREKGGIFTCNSDLYKIYGIDSAGLNKIERNIIIMPVGNNRAGNKILVNKGLSKIELNNADTGTLVRIPGVGPVISKRIVRYRTLLGGFVRLEQLNEIYDINPIAISGIQRMCTIDTSLILKINLNKSDETTLERHPYINKYQAQAINKYRKTKGEIYTLEELLSNNIFTPEELEKVRSYLSVK